MNLVAQRTDLIGTIERYGAVAELDAGVKLRFANVHRIREHFRSCS